MRISDWSSDVCSSDLIRIAGKHAVFGITPAKLGILYPPSDVARLRALVGDGQAARLLFSGMTINGEPARQIGLVEEFVDDANAEALALAKVIDRKSTRLNSSH